MFLRSTCQENLLFFFFFIIILQVCNSGPTVQKSHHIKPRVPSAASIITNCFTAFFRWFQTNCNLFFCLFAASPLMGAQSFPNLTTTGTTSTVTMSTSIVTSGNNVATATTGLSVGQLLSNTLTTSLTSTSSESDTGQEAEFSLYGQYNPTKKQRKNTRTHQRHM